MAIFDSYFFALRPGSAGATSVRIENPAWNIRKVGVPICSERAPAAQISCVECSGNTWVGLTRCDDRRAHDVASDVVEDIGNLGLYGNGGVASAR